MADTFCYKGIKDIINNDLLLFMMEIDTDRKPEQIEPLIRKNHPELLKAFAAKKII